MIHGVTLNEPAIALLEAAATRSIDATSDWFLVELLIAEGFVYGGDYPLLEGLPTSNGQRALAMVEGSE